MRSWCGGGEGFLEEGALEVWSVGWQEKGGAMIKTEAERQPSRASVCGWSRRRMEGILGSGR